MKRILFLFTFLCSFYGAFSQQNIPQALVNPGVYDWSIFGPLSSNAVFRNKFTNVIIGSDTFVWFVDLYGSRALMASGATGGGGGDSTVSVSSPLAGNGLPLNPVRFIPGVTVGDFLRWNGAAWIVAATPYNTAFSCDGALGNVSITDGGSTKTIPTTTIAPLQSVGSPNGTIQITPSPGGIDLIDLAQQSATTTQFLKWNGTKWTPASLPANEPDTIFTSGFLTGNGTAATPAKFINGVSVGDFPRWNGSAWALAAPPATVGSIYTASGTIFPACVATVTPTSSFKISNSGNDDIFLGDVTNAVNGDGIKVSTDRAAMGEVFGANNTYIMSGKGISGNYIRTPSSNFTQGLTSSDIQLISGPFTISDSRSGANKKGLQYTADYSVTMLPENLSIPDNNTVKQLYKAGAGVTIVDSSTFKVIRSYGGNGIYSGSGNIPNGTVATAFSGGTFQFNYNAGVAAMKIDESLNGISLLSKDGNTRLKNLSGSNQILSTDGGSNTVFHTITPFSSTLFATFASSSNTMTFVYDSSFWTKPLRLGYNQTAPAGNELITKHYFDTHLISGVSSVGLSLPSFITVSGSPVTSSGTLTGTLATQTANTTFSGPASGGAAAPTFRALVAADMPAGFGNNIYSINGTIATDTIRTVSINKGAHLREQYQGFGTYAIDVYGGTNTSGANAYFQAGSNDGNNLLNITDNALTASNHTSTFTMLADSSRINKKLVQTFDDASPTVRQLTTAKFVKDSAYIKTFDVSGGNLRIIEGQRTKTVALTSIDTKNGYYGGNSGNGGNGTIPSVTTSTITNQLTLKNNYSPLLGLVPFRIQIDSSGGGLDVDFFSMRNGSDSLYFVKQDDVFKVTATKDLDLLSNDNIVLNSDSVKISNSATAYYGDKNFFMRSPGGFLATKNGLDFNTLNLTTAPDSLIGTNNGKFAGIAIGTGLSLSSGVLSNSASGGITSLNGLTGATQTFATGTSGSNFAISSSGTTHTFNLPDGSASNRGAITSADWTTFNTKYTPSGAITNVPYFSASNVISASTALLHNGTEVGIGIAPVTGTKLLANGFVQANGTLQSEGVGTPTATVAASALRLNNPTASTGQLWTLGSMNSGQSRWYVGGQINKIDKSDGTFWQLFGAQFGKAQSSAALFSVSDSVASSSVVLLENKSTNSAGNELLTLHVANASAGDPAIILDRNSFQYHIGLDNSSNIVQIGTGNTLTTSNGYIQMNASGLLGFGQIAPSATAKTLFAAGTTALTPMRITAGTDVTTPVSGNIENDGTNLKYTNSGATRLLIQAALTGSAALDFPSTILTAVADLTITVTGAALNDPVILGVPNGSVTATATYTAWVSAANTVTVRFSPKATEDPASGTFKVSVIK